MKFVVASSLKFKKRDNKLMLILFTKQNLVLFDF